MMRVAELASQTEHNASTINSTFGIMMTTCQLCQHHS